MFDGLHVARANTLANVVLKLRRWETSRQPQDHTFPVTAKQ